MWLPTPVAIPAVALLLSVTVNGCNRFLARTPFAPLKIAKIWRGGCIIRAKILDRMRAAFAAQRGLVNLMTAGEFSPMVTALTPSLRAAAGMALELGVPALGMCAALGYIDSYRTERLPQNLLQAQRDCFGAHGYERVDRPRGQQFHTEWLD